MGGEKIATAVQTTRHTGSPPRGRGKVLQRGMKQTELRITPAWAGKSYKNLFSAAMKKDHPRVGGEKFIVHVKPFFAVGSPPRGRGKAGSARCASGGDRITPAWAGKSTGGTDAGKQTQDHPRVGGEKTTLGCERQARTGSPPRGRGKARTLSRSAARPGITPAWAGKSRTYTASCQFWEDHPRVGGEKRAAAAVTRGS